LRAVPSFRSVVTSVGAEGAGERQSASGSAPAGLDPAIGEEEWKRFTPVVDLRRCMARIWAEGRGGQCSRQRVQGDEDVSEGSACVGLFCKGHEAEAKRPYGRVDGPIPLEGLMRFRAAAQRASGRRVTSGVAEASASGAVKRARAIGEERAGQMRHGRGLMGQTSVEEAVEARTPPRVEGAAGPADREETQGAGATAQDGQAMGRADGGPMTRSRARAAVQEPGAVAREAGALAAERRIEIEERRGIGNPLVARRMRERAEAAAAHEQEMRNERARGRMGGRGRGGRSAGSKGGGR